jgi:Domain of unknown function (DUF2382)
VLATLGPIYALGYGTTTWILGQSTLRAPVAWIVASLVGWAILLVAASGPEISEDEHEVILREEEPVVEKRAVPKERVRLAKDTVTGQERVAEEVRKEQIDVDDEDTSGGRHERRRRR